MSKKKMRMKDRRRIINTLLEKKSKLEASLEKGWGPYQCQHIGIKIGKLDRQLANVEVN